MSATSGGPRRMGFQPMQLGEGDKELLTGQRNLHGQDAQATSCSRREWLRSAGRYATLGGVVGGISLLVLRPRQANGEACIRPIACGGCDQFDGCALPKAAAAREKA